MAAGFRSRSSGSREEMSFTAKDIQFQKELPENFELECPICFEILINEPYLAACCGRHYCGSCTHKILNSGSNRCPLCNSDARRNFTIVRDLSHDRSLKSQLVYCTNRSEGCHWSKELKHLQAHLTNSCPYVTVKCPKCFQGGIKRCDLKDHSENLCSRRTDLEARMKTRLEDLQSHFQIRIATMHSELIKECEELKDKYKKLAKATQILKQAFTVVIALEIIFIFALFPHQVLAFSIFASVVFFLLYCCNVIQKSHLQKLWSSLLFYFELEVELEKD